MEYKAKLAEICLWELQLEIQQNTESESGHLHHTLIIIILSIHPTEREGQIDRHRLLETRQSDRETKGDGRQGGEKRVGYQERIGEKQEESDEEGNRLLVFQDSVRISCHLITVFP